MRWLAPLPFLLLLGWASQANAVGEPWAVAAGERFVRFSSRTVFGSGGFMVGGDYVDVGSTYIDSDLELYAEFGVTDALTVIGSATAFGYATMGDRATTYIGPLCLAARLGLPRLAERIEGLQLGLEVTAGFNPGFGDQRIGAALLADQRIWEYTATLEHHYFGAALRLGYRLDWGIYLLVQAGVRARNQPKDLGAIFHGTARLGLETEAGVDLEAGLLWLQPTGEVVRSNFSGATGSRQLGASISITLWLIDTFGVFAGAEGNFLAEAARPGPFVLAGLVHR